MSKTGQSPQLKVCGINDAVFARAADAAGVDYLGFIFAAKSPRRVTVSQAVDIVRQLSARIRKVGVFVTQTAAEIAETMRLASLDIVQLHRRAAAEDVATLRRAGFEVWTLDGGADGDAVVIDSPRGGGSGTLGDWSRVATAHARGARVVLAGGLGADNLREAAATGADVLDVNSSLETAPGVKSVERLNQLFKRT